MRNILFLLLCFGIFQNAQSQTDSSKPQSSEDNSIYNSAGIEVKPEFKGGLSKFYTYIIKNYRSPGVPGLKGQVLVSFVIEKDGSITDITYPQSVQENVVFLSQNISGYPIISPSTISVCRSCEPTPGIPGNTGSLGYRLMIAGSRRYA